MADEVTTGEIVRRLDHITGQLAQITTTLAEDRRHNTETFVRKDVLAPLFETVKQRIADAEKDIEDGKAAMAEQQRRSRATVIALLSIGVPTLVSVILWVLTAFQPGA